MKIKNILVNTNEEKSYNILSSIMEKHGYRVFPKIRVADVFEINPSLLDKEQFYYALSAHFDFTIVDENNLPQFSVEFDGLSHSSSNAQRKDQFKNEICLKHQYPLIRIYEIFFQRIGKFTVLSWLLEVWCLAQAFYEAQANGNISEEEDFDYWAAIEITSDLKLTFPYNPFYNYRQYLKSLSWKKKIISLQGIHYKTDTDRTCCLTVLIIDTEKSLRQSFSTQSYQSYAYFPVSDFDLCEEMSLYFLYQKYQNYLKTGKGASNSKEISIELNNIAKSRKYYGSFCSTTDLNISTPN